MTDDTRKPYEPPEIESESAFEILSAGCTHEDPAGMAVCDPDFGGYVYEDF